MALEEAIEMLRGMQNKKVDYAEMVRAPAFAYGYQYVYPEPEDYVIEEAISALKEIQQYREIGTVEECREAVEKQIPKKAEIYTDTIQTMSASINQDVYLCPVCGEFICNAEDELPNYCSYCGQAINDENLEGIKDVTSEM